MKALLKVSRLLCLGCAVSLALLGGKQASANARTSITQAVGTLQEATPTTLLHPFINGRPRLLPPHRAADGPVDDPVRRAL